MLVDGHGVGLWSGGERTIGATSHRPGTVSSMDRRKPSALSPSSIDLWEQCPRRYEQEKVLRRESLPGIDAVVGTFVHRVLELLMQGKPGERTIDLARRAAKQAWAELQMNNEYRALGIELDSAEALEFRRRAWQSIRGYFEMENPNKVEVVATEQYVEVTIAGVPMRGIIDRLDRDVFDDLVVTDYKSGKVPYKTYQGPKMRQLNLYAAMVGEKVGERPTDGRLLFTTFGKELTTRFTEDSIDEALQVAFAVWESLDRAMESGEFEPKPGPLCGWCPFVTECPEGLDEIRERRAAGKLKKSAPAYDLAVSD